MKLQIEDQHSFEILLVMNDATTRFHFTTLIFPKSRLEIWVHTL